MTLPLGCPRRMVSRRRIPIGLSVFHWTMIVGAP